MEKVVGNRSRKWFVMKDELEKCPLNMINSFASYGESVKE